MCQYDVQVSVGGVPCLSVYSYVSYFYCSLPNFDYDPSVAYDVVVYNDAGTATLSGLVQYTSAPTLISIDPCIDRGDRSREYSDARCPVGTTITLLGTRFPAANAVSVHFSTRTSTLVDLLAATRINSTAITATLPAFNNATTAAAVLGAYGSVQAVFSSADVNTTSNMLSTRLYLLPNTPSITSVSSSSCDSVSALQLTNCRALAVITVAGSNLAVSGRVLMYVYLASAWQGYNYLLPDGSDSSTAASNGTWYDSLSNTSLVFTLAYFDADTNVQLQPDVVYTVLITPYSSTNRVSNAFRLSLTYDSATSSTSASSSLSSGAIAGIVIAAVVAAVLLLMVVVWLLRRPSGSSWWSSKSSDESSQWSTRRAGGSSSDDFKDVELQ